MEQPDMKYQPDEEYKYWLLDQEGDGMMFFRTREERDAHGQRCIDGHLEDMMWHDEVEGICAGEITVTHTAKVLNKRMRPEDYDLDEDGLDDRGVSWPDEIGWRGHYTLEPLTKEV